MTNEKPRTWDSLTPGTILALDRGRGYSSPHYVIVLSSVVHPPTNDPYHRGYMLWDSWIEGQVTTTCSHASLEMPPMWRIICEA